MTEKELALLRQNWEGRVGQIPELGLRLLGEFERLQDVADAARILSVIIEEPAFAGLTTPEDYWSYYHGASLGLFEKLEAFDRTRSRLKP
jgi:glycerol kinase